MANLHVDLYNGNDANDGSTWALAKKTVPSTGTDNVKVAKSPDPVSIGDATWTQESNVIVMDTALTKTIDLCVGNTWTMGANVTGGYYSYRKYGSNCQQFALTTSATGLVGYKTLPAATDFSAFTKLSFYVSGNSYASINARNFRICLCSDSAGTTIVNTIYLDDLTYNNNLHVFVCDNGGALGSSIQSVALYCDAGSAVQIRFSVLIACNDFTLKSLLGKSNTLIGAEWFPIACIDDKNIYLDYGNFNGYELSYIGETENTLTYRREAIEASVTLTAAKIVQFGWNKNTDTQESETWLDGINLYGTGFNVSSALSTVENIAVVRFATGINIYRLNYIKNANVIGCLTKSILIGCRTDEQGKVENITIQNNTGVGEIRSNFIDGLKVNSNRVGNNPSVAIKNNNTIIRNLIAMNNYAVGISLTLEFSVTGSIIYSASNNLIENVELKNNYSYGLIIQSGGNKIHNLILNNDRFDFHDFTEVYDSDELPAGTNQWGGYGTTEFNRGRVAGAFKQTFLPTNTLVWQTETKQDGANGAWCFSLGSGFQTEMRYTTDAMRLAEIAVESNVPIIFKVWVKLTNLDGVKKGRLAVRKLISPVVGDDYFTEIPISADWQEISMAITPVRTGVIVFELQAFGDVYYVGSISIIS